jgi:hypothetical protein
LTKCKISDINVSILNNFYQLPAKTASEYFTPKRKAKFREKTGQNADYMIINNGHVTIKSMG